MPGSRIIAARQSIAARPMSRPGWRTVVSAGLIVSAQAVLSKPVTATSVGQRRPASSSAAIAPTACTSQAQVTAVGGSSRASSFVIPS